MDAGAEAAQADEIILGSPKRSCTWNSSCPWPPSGRPRTVLTDTTLEGEIDRLNGLKEERAVWLARYDAGL